MASLFDIAPPELARETVDIRGTVLEVRGLREREWLMLLRRFPQLQGRAADGEAPVDDDAALAALDVVAPVIAAGLGKIGDATEEALVDERLSDAEQARVFNAIMRLTMPPVPLAAAPADAAGAKRSGETPATPTPSPSNS